MSEIPICQPQITPDDVAAVTAALRSGRLSVGPRLARFEEVVADRAERVHGIATSSGTAALHLVLSALGVGPGDQVITTPFAFIASANAIVYTGATPVFVDIDPVSLNMDPTHVRQAINDHTKAILAVHTFGNTTHIETLAKIAQAHEIPLIEDACQAMGGRHADRPVGSFGRAAVFSFYTNKPVTTGEGGMIVTDDDRLADAARSMRNHGRPCVTDDDIAPPVAQPGSPFLEHERLGYNYRLPEPACALGVSQMDRLNRVIDDRRRVANLYMQRLLDWQDLIMPNMPAGDTTQVSWFAFVIRLSDLYAQPERDRIINGLRRHEIGAANYFPAIHLTPHYRRAYQHDKGAFPIAESVAQRTLALPFYPTLDDTHIELIVHTLKVMLQREQLLKRD